MTDAAYSNAGRTWRAVSLAPLRPVLYTIASFAVSIALWQLGVSLAGQDFQTIPSPADVWNEFLVVAANGVLVAYIVDSLGRWLAGTAIGLFTGVILAITVGTIRSVRLMLLPVVRFFSGIAELSFLPLLVLWFGFGFKAMLALIAYSVVFPVLYNTLQALETIPRSLTDAVQTLGARRAQLIRYVLLPGAVSGIVTGFRIGAGYAFRALIAAEIFASSSGLGYMIFQSRETLNVSRMFVGMTIIGLMWLSIDRFYLRPFELATTTRWGLEREQ